MNILFLSTVYPHPAAPVRGTFNWQLCQALQTHGGVRVVSPCSWLDGLRHSGRQLVDVPGHVVTEWPTFLYPPRVLRGLHGRFMWWSVRRAVRRATKQFPLDWVLSYWAFPDGDAGLRAARNQGAKSAVIVGGSDVLLLPAASAQRDAVVRVLRESDAVITVCDGLRERCIELGADPVRVHTIFQGVDRAVFQRGSRAEARFRLSLPLDAPVFLWVGRFVDVKRVDLLIRGFKEFLKGQPDARLYLVGSGPLEALMRRLVSQWDLTESIRFAGPVNQQDLPTWYQAADATVLTSHSEGLPNVLRESLACGTPFVATNVGSISEIAEPSHSILIPTNNEAALSTALNDILDPIYQAGAECYQPLSWEQSARELVRLLYRVGKKSRPTATRRATSRQEARS